MSSHWTVADVTLGPEVLRFTLKGSDMSFPFEGKPPEFLHDWRFLPAKEAREQIDSPLFLGALRMPRSGLLSTL